MSRSLTVCGALGAAILLACSGVATPLGVTAQPATTAAPAPAAAPARPQLHPVAGVDNRLLAPAGWTGSTEQHPLPDGSVVQAFTVAERAGASDSPTVLVMTFPLFQGAQTPDLFVEELKAGFTDLQQVSSAQADGAKTEVWTGTLTGIPATIAIRSGADPSGSQGMVVSFAAPSERFGALGGTWMLDAIFPASPTESASSTPSQRAAHGGLEWHRCRCTDRKYGMTVPYTVCAADPLGAAYWETIAVACMPDGCRNCRCSPTYESCSQDGQML